MVAGFARRATSSAKVVCGKRLASSVTSEKDARFARRGSVDERRAASYGNPIHVHPADWSAVNPSRFDGASHSAETFRRASTGAVDSRCDFGNLAFCFWTTQNANHEGQKRPPRAVRPQVSGRLRLAIEAVPLDRLVKPQQQLSTNRTSWAYSTNSRAVA